MIWWHDSFTTIKPTCKKRLRVERPRGDSWTPCAYPYPKSLRLETITQFSGNIGVWRDAVSTSSSLSGSLWKGLLAGFWGWKFRRSYAASILTIQQLVWYSNSLQSSEVWILGYRFAKHRVWTLWNERFAWFVCAFLCNGPFRASVTTGLRRAMEVGQSSWWRGVRHGGAIEILWGKDNQGRRLHLYIDVNGDVLFLSKYPDTLSPTVNANL